jgi:tRNA threonylcarbamoyladenosine biosynthesis protein TsaE
MRQQTLPAAGDFPYRGATSSSPATGLLGARAARRLQGGEVLLLWGPLGAGKTCFVQGLCRALGVSEEVTIPSFTLAHRYAGRLVVHHLDFYRIAPDDDLTDVGVEAVIDEVEQGGAVLVVEWPLPLLPLLGSRLEMLALPGAAPEERLWYLRGVPDLPAIWRDLLAPEGNSC